VKIFLDLIFTGSAIISAAAACEIVNNECLCQMLTLMWGRENEMLYCFIWCAVPNFEEKEERPFLLAGVMKFHKAIKLVHFNGQILPKGHSDQTKTFLSSHFEF
jgi:hypothetical protein